MHRTSFVLLAGTVLAVFLVLVGATRGPARAHAPAHAGGAPAAHVRP
jgi:hypothetical protein